MGERLNGYQPFITEAPDHHNMGIVSTADTSASLSPAFIIKEPEFYETKGINCFSRVFFKTSGTGHKFRLGGQQLLQMGYRGDIEARDSIDIEHNAFTNQPGGVIAALKATERDEDIELILRNLPSDKFLLIIANDVVMDYWDKEKNDFVSYNKPGNGMTQDDIFQQICHLFSKENTVGGYIPVRIKSGDALFAPQIEAGISDYSHAFSKGIYSTQEYFVYVNPIPSADIRLYVYGLHRDPQNYREVQESYQRIITKYQHHNLGQNMRNAMMTGNPEKDLKKVNAGIIFQHPLIAQHIHSIEGHIIEGQLESPIWKEVESAIKGTPIHRPYALSEIASYVQNRSRTRAGNIPRSGLPRRIPGNWIDYSEQIRSYKFN